MFVPIELRFITGLKVFCRKILQYPLFISLVYLTIVSLSLLTLYSAAQGSLYPWCARQAINALIAISCCMVVSSINIRYIYRYSYFIYFIALLLLLFVLLFGYSAMGATRWINIIGFRFQPSELVKLALILVLARYFDDLNRVHYGKVLYLIPAILFIITPALFVAKQPDLSTTMVLLFVGTIVLWLAEVRLWKFITVFVIVLIAIPIVWYSDILHDYQKNRILTFLNPESNPMSLGYNIIQSKIAIGSGGILGKGLMAGSQSQLDFLPEHQTDFIFTTFAEEWGFVGSVLILSFYIILIKFCLKVGMESNNFFQKLLASGIGYMIGLQVLINCAMIMGLIPAAGVPLPLMSYGGTNLIVTSLALGLVMNVYLNNIQHN